MDAGTGFTSQVYQLSPLFGDKDWISEQLEKDYFISAIAGANNGSSLDVMSKGTPYSNQSFTVSENFPFTWIKRNWKKGYHVIAMATTGNKWAIVMSLGTGFSDQAVELDFLYPREGIEQRWIDGYKITSTAATCDQVAFVFSLPRNPGDANQLTEQTSVFPSRRIKENWAKNKYVSSMCYGRTIA